MREVRRGGKGEWLKLVVKFLSIYDSDISQFSIDLHLRRILNFSQKENWSVLEMDLAGTGSWLKCTNWSGNFLGEEELEKRVVKREMNLRVRQSIKTDSIRFFIGLVDPPLEIRSIVTSPFPYPFFSLFRIF